MMPGKYETLRLSQSQDRRRKLTDEQKEKIRELYATKEYSSRTLAQMYGVSKSTVLIIVNPSRARQVSQRIKEHWKDYQPTKDVRAAIMKEHRHYKRDLYNKGELKSPC